jgi:hypothetical protein
MGIKVNSLFLSEKFSVGKSFFSFNNSANPENCANEEASESPESSTN